MYARACAARREPVSLPLPQPILFFGQLLTAGTAVAFAAETIKLRGEVEAARGGSMPGQPERRRSRRRSSGVRLPPAGAASSSYGSWTGRGEEEEGDERRRRDEDAAWEEEGRAGSDEFEAAFDAARRGEKGQKPVDARDLLEGRLRGSASDDWE